MDADKRRFFPGFLKTIKSFRKTIRVYPRSFAVHVVSRRFRSIFIFATALLTFNLQPSLFNVQTFKPSNVSPNALTIPITFGNAASSRPSLSADGRFVAFESLASDLASGDTNQVADIIVYDRQRTAFERVSVASDGTQANAASSRPSLSADGRFVAFESLASNLVSGDTNAMSDIFVHDRLTGETSRISINLHGEQGDGPSEAASISGNGRWVAFLSMAANLFPYAAYGQRDANGQRDAFLYDRLTGLQQRISIGPNGEDANGPTNAVSINAAGTTVAFLSDAGNLVEGTSPAQTRLFTYNLGDFRIRQIAPAQGGDRPTLSELGLWVSYLSPAALQDATVYAYNTWNKELRSTIFPLPVAQQALSGDGQQLFALGTANGETFSLYQHSFANGETHLLAEGVLNLQPALSADGQVAAFVQMKDGISQIQVADLHAEINFTYTVHGQVLSPLGDPLAQVTVTDSRGHATESDQAGRFFLGGVPKGKVTLTASKKGFTFQPATTTLTVSGDTGDVQFRYAYSDVLAEARLDIGMPYDHRCENGPACLGDFHGYAAGQCTDLVLDAFTWGAETNFQLALWRDAQAHPEHLYQTGNPRDAYDMWRYFAYTSQMLPNEQPYQAGDLVFFDWSGNGEINHVALVSQVDKNNHPTYMVDATGVIDSNPSGLAAELPWEAFHENSARGHARWNGIHQPPVVGLQPTQALQVGVGSSGVRLRLLSLKGGMITPTMNTLPGGAFFDLTWEQNISVLNPTAYGHYYFVWLDNPTSSPLSYYFVAQTRREWEFGGVVMFTGALQPGQNRLIPLWITTDGELRTFNGSALRNPRQRR
jgi:Tol biopolymer transport system component